MRHRQFLSRASLAALIMLALAGPAAAQTGRVGGIVKDDGGNAIKGATVIAENANIGQSLTATTDDKGRFTIIGLRAGTWRFVAQAPGFAPQGGEAPIRMGAPNPPISFSLTRTGNAYYGALGGIAAKDLQADVTAADALFNQGKWDESIAAYRAIASKAPALSVINLQVAAAYRNKKDYDAAVAAYKDLLKVDPGNESAQIGIAQTYVERGDLQAAERALEAAAGQLNPGREVFFQLGELKLANGKSDEALKWYGKAAEADPAWGKPLYKLGVAALGKGDKNSAAKFLNQVLAVDPVSPEAAMARSSLDTLK